MAVHQLGDPDLHRVLWHPPRDGGPHLPHPVHGAGQAGNFGALGEAVEMGDKEAESDEMLLGDHTFFCCDPAG